MGMVVRTNTMAINSFRQLGMNNSQVSKSLEKLSSGYKINRAGDDASGLAISEKMKAQIRGLETASTNCQDGVSLVQTAEGALTEVHNMLNRMVELAGKAANGTMDEDIDRQALQNEMNELADEIERIGDSTNFNGIKLLNGDYDGSADDKKLQLQIGDTSEQTMKVSISSVKTAKVFEKTTVKINGEDKTAATKETENGATALEITSVTKANAAIAVLRGDLNSDGTVKGAINYISEIRAKLGATQNRLEYTINNLDVNIENMEAANSRIRDTDMAEEMMEYTQTNVLVQAAQAMLAQANQQPQSVLQLLQ